MTNRTVRKKAKTSNSYIDTRYNAMKHGALSCVPVLPWEDADELAKIQEALMQEYKPQGASEEYLIIEMANCIFRKQRLHKAERALIVNRMDWVSNGTLRRAADLLASNLTVKLSCHSNELDFKKILYDDGLYQEQDEETIAHKKYLTDVQAVLDADLSYEEMLEQCPADAVTLWRDWLKDDDSKYRETKASFEEFLQTEIIGWCEGNLSIKKALPQLKQQLLGLSYVPDDKMEQLQRHEAALDRRFEKNLAMLLKLQEVRKVALTLVTEDISKNSVL